ncbi:hypothetical protein [Caulobacter mirabilis]|uniref:Uncharacterized protein n=1 Tax=Caulobacter mirabilis TaxID=69666 RepID=A0A2D2AX64_9CAUL|nr:hypothetical protein [Caulobacter mirabilis]ATQ42604.1 hypothetical protein CSW64_09390 [Caulobacter mirabilis]
MTVLSATLALSLLLHAGALQDEAAAIAAPTPAPAASPAALKAPAGTELQVELIDPVSSATSKLGDRFAIRLAEAVVIDGIEVAPAGAVGQGEVVDVAKAGFGGKQGKLIISARYLELNGRQARVRGMSLMAAGKSRVDLATGVWLTPYVGVAAYAIRGGQIEIPAGTRAMVRLAEDLEFQRSAAAVSGETPK